jgi:predicted ATP-dependent endonuclease of OLD family
LVGANNSGKSSVINAIRVFWGDAELGYDDFHKDEQEIEVEVGFSISEYFFNSIVDNEKVGFQKIPTTATEFNSIKENTTFSGVTFNAYKEYRLESINIQNQEQIRECLCIWRNAITKRLNVENNSFFVLCKASKGEKKGKHFNSSGDEIKDFTSMIHKLAFIDDDRNFTEEGEGKTKSLTSKILGSHIMRNKDDECTLCVDVDCTRCIERIADKSVSDLDINDLERLINNKARELSRDVSTGISEFFKSNFHSDYDILLNASSNVDKSFSVNTKIFVPQLNKYVELSKVGAGVRSIYVLSLLQAYLKLENSNNNIFIIEEPEIYLHPQLQKLMASIIYEISRDNLVILSTHSPLIINRFELASLRKVKLNNDYETDISNTDLSEVLQELGYSTADILFTEYIIFVEGIDDKRRLEKIITTFYNVDLSKFYIIDTKSCNNIEIYANLRFLNKTNLWDNFLIFRDSDTMDPESVILNLMNKFRENLEGELLPQIEEKIHVFEYGSFDNYFLKPEILQSINVVNSGIRFHEIVENYLDNNSAGIREYLEKKNNADRADELYGIIYDNRNVIDKMEDIKKYVRGHNLFGLFGNLKRRTEVYIENSSSEDFKEVLEHLNKIPYLAMNIR